MLVAVAVLMPMVVAATRPMHVRRRGGHSRRPLAHKLHRHRCRRRGVGMVVVAVVMPAAGAVHMAVVVMIVGLVRVAMVLMPTARPMHMSVIMAMVVPARGWGHIGCKAQRHFAHHHVPVAQGVTQGGIGLYEQVVGFHGHRHTLLAQAISRTQQVGGAAMLRAWADAPQQLGCGLHHR